MDLVFNWRNFIAESSVATVRSSFRDRQAELSHHNDGEVRDLLVSSVERS